MEMDSLFIPVIMSSISVAVIVDSYIGWKWNQRKTGRQRYECSETSEEQQGEGNSKTYR
jgi:hypothetical protein